jgi:hypothetical protein
MELPFTKSELERLLELVALGEEVLNGRRPEGEPSAAHAAALQKFFAFADDAGLGYLIGVDEKADQLRPSEALITRLDEEIEAYDDCIFWDELAIRMAERDIRREMGTQAYDALTEHERHTRTDALAEAYDKEFRQRGIESLLLPAGRKVPTQMQKVGDAVTEKLRKLFDDKS